MKKMICISLISFLLAGCTNASSQENPNIETPSETPMTSTIDSEIKLESTDWQNENPITIDLNHPQNGTGYTVNERQILITQAGTYVLSGEYEGQIRVNLSTDENVRLVLNNVNLTNQEDAVLYIERAKNCILTLADKSNNTLSDGNSYMSTTEATATIYSKDDLKINGEGSLSIDANYNNAIQSKDDLFILGGNIEIEAKDKGLVGKDSIQIAAGMLSIQSGKDSMQATNSEDATKGYILINGGTLNLISSEDGIQAETQCLINGGEITITTGSGSETVAMHNSDEELSIKGIKAGTDLSISAGKITINSEDDALHSNGTLTVNGGVILLSTNDDGIHADQQLTIADGEINISKSYEGLESLEVILLGGEIQIKSSDDGINGAGGKDASGQITKEGFTKDNFQSGSGLIRIQGGEIVVDAEGDGIDCNGSVEMSGGTVIVFGPSNGNNGTLDYDGTLTINGGTLVAIGSSQMLMTPSETSTQYSISTTAAHGEKDNTILITDQDNQVLWSGFAQKNFDAVLYSDPTLAQNESYSIYVNDTLMETITVDTIVSGTTSGQPGTKGQRPNPQEGMVNGSHKGMPDDLPENAKGGPLPNDKGQTSE